MSIQAALIASPSPTGMIVNQVVLDGGKTVWTLGAAGPRPAPRRSYASLEDAVDQNSRASTTGFLVQVQDDEAAVAMLGKAPPQA